ncbi:unnamed protein product, partial [Didymodactylos carnosus]
DWERVYDLVQGGIDSNVVRPLAANIFDSNNIEQAFRYMAQGKHVGKVVIKVYNELNPRIRAIRKTWFSPQKTYIITGGLGGFGLELAQWLVEQIFFETNIYISKHDPTNNKQCHALIDYAHEKMAPVGGIFHLAAILQDGLLENLDVQKFQQVIDIKYHGTMCLDSVTREKCSQSLDYFVVFSSISCGRGNAGQTNYGFANSTMERICEKRRQDGLPDIFLQQQQNEIKSAVVSSYVLAEKVQKTSIVTTSLLETIAHILGIKDANTMNNNSTLSDLGLDSLGSVEIKQLLEQNFQYTITHSKDIQQLTVKELKEIDSKKEQKITVSTEEKIFSNTLDTLLPQNTVVELNDYCTKDKKNDNTTRLFIIH